MARPAGIEPTTFWSVVKRSIQLSYGRIFRCSYQQCFVIITESVLNCNNFFSFFYSLIFRIGGDDGTRTRTMFPSPDFKSDASTDSATSPINWRYLPDLNWRSQSCSLLPYHLAKVPLPFRCALLLYMNSYQNARLKWNDFRRFSKRKRRRLRRLFSYAQSTKTQLFNCF